MEFFHKQTTIDFMGLSRYTAVFSVLVCVISFSLLWTKGLNFGLDFMGGAQIELRYEAPIETDYVRSLLQSAGYHDAKVIHYGSTQDILVRISKQAEMSELDLAHKVKQVLADDEAHPASLRRVEFVGSEVGSQLAEQGTLAVVVAILATMLYIALRFEYRFAVSAAVALLHDPVLILGIFAGLQIEFDLATLAAILSVVGYSLNDTIVVFDRVRENFLKVRQSTPTEIMNLSINQTLSRTIMTSFMTLMVVVALFFFGGESLHGFSTALLIGILIGTYSSIYVAGAFALKLGLSRIDLLPKSHLEVIDNQP
jgi:preprotein translocase subunit SecF